MHSFSYTNDQVLLYNQFSPYFLCRVSWLPIITNLGSVSKIRLNEYQLKSISFNYNICGIWKIFNNTRKRKYGLNTNVHCIYTHVYHCWFILWEWISQRNLASMAKSEMRCPFREIHANDSLFIKDLVRWHQWQCYKDTFRNSDIMLISQ